MKWSFGLTALGGFVGVSLFLPHASRSAVITGAESLSIVCFYRLFVGYFRNLIGIFLNLPGGVGWALEITHCAGKEVGVRVCQCLYMEKEFMLSAGAQSGWANSKLADSFEDEIEAFTKWNTN